MQPERGGGLARPTYKLGRPDVANIPAAHCNALLDALRHDISNREATYTGRPTMLTKIIRSTGALCVNSQSNAPGAQETGVDT